MEAVRNELIYLMDVCAYLNGWTISNIERTKTSKSSDSIQLTLRTYFDSHKAVLSGDPATSGWYIDLTKTVYPQLLKYLSQL